MSASPQLPAAENQLIARLPRSERQRLVVQGELVRLELGAVLGEPGEATRYVYFPIDSFVSLVAGASGPERVEVGMVGREGMVGVQIALGVATTPLHAMVQGAGSARRIRATRIAW